MKDLRSIKWEDLQAAAGEVFAELIMKIGLPFLPVIDGYILDKGYNANLEAGSYLDIPYMLGSTENDLTVTREQQESGEMSPIYKGCAAWSENQVRLGRKASYLYYFKRSLPGDGNGAFHSSELWYMFGTLRRSWRPMTEQDIVLSEKMVGYWTNFIKTGNPNGTGLNEGNLPVWETYTKENPQLMEFDI